MTQKIDRTIEHESREANLKAEKRSVRKAGNAYLMRHTDMAADVIDIVRRGEIIERHVCTVVVPSPDFCRKEPFRVEVLALYQ